MGLSSAHQHQITEERSKEAELDPGSGYILDFV